MLDAYFPILLFIGVAIAVGAGPTIAGWVCSTLLGMNRPDSEKLSPYECGFEAFEDARMKFDVRYYLVAILFILFDLEIASTTHLSLSYASTYDQITREIFAITQAKPPVKLAHSHPHHPIYKPAN